MSMLPDEEVEEEAEPSSEAEESDAVETEARSMGWVPLEEFRGPKDKWRGASEFVDRGSTVLPIVNSLLKKERAKTSQLETKLAKSDAEWRDKFGRLEKMSTAALENQREQLMSQFADKKEAAVERGDMDAYRTADKAEKKALADLDEKVAAKEEKQKDTRADLPEAVRETLDAWVVDNQWFVKDPEANAWANAYHVKLLDKEPGLTLEENLAKVRSQAKVKFPELFGVEDKAKRGSRVESGSRNGGGGGGTLYSKLQSDAKQIADKQISLYLEPGETIEKDGLRAKERWARVYFDQPGV